MDVNHAFKVESLPLIKLIRKNINFLKNTSLTTIQQLLMNFKVYAMLKLSLNIHIVKSYYTSFKENPTRFWQSINRKKIVIIWLTTWNVLNIKILQTYRKHLLFIAPIRMLLVHVMIIIILILTSRIRNYLSIQRVLIKCLLFWCIIVILY